MGQVVTFDLINTGGDEHREFKATAKDNQGAVGRECSTQGDNADVEDQQRSTDFIIGVYEGKLPWIAKWCCYSVDGLPALHRASSFVILFYCLNSFSSYRSLQGKEQTHVGLEGAHFQELKAWEDKN